MGSQNLNRTWKILALIFAVLCVVLIVVIVVGNDDKTPPVETSTSENASSTDNHTIKPAVLTEAEAYELCLMHTISGNLTCPNHVSRYDVDPLLVLAIISVESSYNSQADSGVAKGLMQIRPETYNGDIKMRVREFADKDESILFDPDSNVLCGTYYLYRLSKSFENVNEIIVAYNWGITNVLNLLCDTTGQYTLDGKTLIYENIPSESAKNYLNKVTSAYEFLKIKYDK
ncbi:MAG: lytic transglycosylase domain-containing protein [Clostridia bacterium]|nr:lytic transglycosylase domain-containing protein [Clostridia bacterium]